MKERVRLLHWKATGIWPSYSFPKTLSEKICWRKAHLIKFYDANKLLSLTCDKVTVREFISKIGLGQHLTQFFLSFRNWHEIKFEGLPRKFVLKISNGSTMNHFVENIDHENISTLEIKCKKWLNRKWGSVAGEWWYLNAPPRILVEEWLNGSDHAMPDDYKFFVAKGKVLLIQHDYGKNEDYRRSLYYPPWRYVSATFNGKKAGGPVEAPKSLEEMLYIAEAVGAYFDFARVDLYACGSRIIIGEITHAPASGWIKFSNPSMDQNLGNMMDDYGPDFRWRPNRVY